MRPSASFTMTSTNDIAAVMRRRSSSPAVRGMRPSSGLECQLCHLACTQIPDHTGKQLCHIACDQTVCRW